MLANATTLKVTSHVGRDLLQAAASFKSDHAVVWEYVVNSLQYVEEGVLPKVYVLVRPKSHEIEITDNGRGMRSADLERYFMMHAENADRQRGKTGRGKFGTGKSAAFGIGRVLTVDTCRDRTRNVVRLTRDAIDRSTGDAIPVEWLTRNEATDRPNGTSVTIGGIVLTRIGTPNIIEYIERHLQAFRALLPEVAVNEHVCQYREPQVLEAFEFNPSAEQAKVIGDVSLVVKVSLSPLPQTEVGIAITAGIGNLVAIESGGVDRKEMGNYLFGEVDVPTLEMSSSAIEPYDATRSLQLNPQHPVCSVLIPFIASKLEEIRQRQVRKLSEARKTEEARRLATEAHKIAEILNQDFRRMVDKLDGIRAAAASPGSAGAKFGTSAGADDSPDAWAAGIAQPGDVEQHTGPENSGNGHQGRSAPNIARGGNPNDNGQQTIDPTGGKGARPRPRGGFRVDYRSLGNAESRSAYDATNLTILINLDHPAVKNALRNCGVEDPTFKRLSYEIAFTEYSVALGYEMAERDPDIPANDLLYEVRATLNRVATSAAALYNT
jgi:hypothetical protein